MVKILLALLASVLCLPAHAINIGIQGGLAFPGGDAFANAKTGNVIGAELTLGLADELEVGAFYDDFYLPFEQVLMSAGGETLTARHVRHYGAVGRVTLPSLGVFADAKLGLAKHVAGSLASDSVFGAGLGIGYRWEVLPVLAISPRAGYRLLPSSFDGNSDAGGAIELGLLAQLRL
jgi:hypothetical protein